MYIALDERRPVAGVRCIDHPDLVLVETLTGHDDRIDQAEALAVDYAAEQTAYLAGRREIVAVTAAAGRRASAARGVIRRRRNEPIIRSRSLATPGAARLERGAAA